MQKVFVMYKLRPGVSLDQYKEWSREIDQRTTPRQPNCSRFEVYAIQGAEDGEPRYQIVEDIEVESWRGWQETVAGDGMKRVVADFPKYADESTVHVIYGSRIV